MSPLTETSARGKLLLLESAVQRSLRVPDPTSIPGTPGRDVDLLPPELHPKKVGLSLKEGQARLLHDLASIELQAMELAFRTLNEYPDAPAEFREEMAMLAISEGEHLRLCLDAIENLGFRWGAWPAHVALWRCVGVEDNLLDRVLIVHRYLEGSGLDAGDTLLRRLGGVERGPTHEVVGTIVREEVGHVEFGSRWFRELCREKRVDPDAHFRERLREIQTRLPKRIEPVSHELRLRAGFSLKEIGYLEELRLVQSKFEPRRVRGVEIENNAHK